MQEQKTIQNEINKLSNLLDKVSYQKLKYEEDILEELKKKSLANNSCVQINNKISELKVQNKEHVLIIIIYILKLLLFIQNVININFRN